MKIDDRFKDLVLENKLSVLLDIFTGTCFLDTRVNLEFSDTKDPIYIYGQSVVKVEDLQNYHLRGTGYYCIESAKAWLKKENIWIEPTTKLTLIYFERINNDKEKSGFDGI